MQLLMKVRTIIKLTTLALTYKEGPVDFAAAYERYEENSAIGAVSVMASVLQLHIKSHLN